jgi:NAD(P)-dependent dehydrogenase (short-subunit alcohol dehydrogenase family)
VVVVTGAGQGIGVGIARSLLDAGLRVVIVDRNQDRVDRVLADLGSGASAILADVSDPEAVDRLAVEVDERLGRWDVLVNNAGAVRLGGVESTTPSLWDEAMVGCVKTAFLCTRAAAPRMRAAGWGRIVNIASVVAHGSTSRELVGYASAKAALLGFTKAAARELGPDGITVNAVSPGAVDTPSFDRFPDPDAIRAERASQAVMGRLGTPSDIGAAVVFLSSEGAGFVTGQTLLVDGGRTDKL